jgi:hypothetical protein
VRLRTVEDRDDANVNFYVNEEANAAGFRKMTSIINIMLTDGRCFGGRAEFGKGSPADPMS